MSLNKIIFKFVRFSLSVLLTLLIVACLVKVGSLCYGFGYRVFTEKPVEEAPGTEKTVEITPDMSERGIGTLLRKEGLVRDEDLFYVQLKLSAYAGKLKPGRYDLNTSMTAKEMMAIMAADSGGDTETESEAP